MTDPTVTDLRRELEKAREALDAAETHLARQAEATAALHCADRVMYSPLHAKVQMALRRIGYALARTEQPRVPTLDSQSPDGPWAALVADLDRCMHGRHQGDDCGNCDGIECSCQAEQGYREMHRKRYAAANVPGSTAEQLPNDVLAVLDMPPYLSTACQTAQACEAALPRLPGGGKRATHLHQRCRRNHKFTGQTCTCTCHS